MLRTVAIDYHTAVTAALALGLLSVLSRGWRWSLVIDAAAVVLYAVRPQPATLAFVGVQALIRYVPELARQTALLLRLQSVHGWTAAAVLVLLPGLARYTAKPSAAPKPAATGATVPLPARVLRTAEWAAILNDRPDDVPHVFVEGGSGTGKTTFVHAVLAFRDGPVVAIGVKFDDIWSGGYVYQSDAREAALDALQEDIRRRLDADDRSGLTIIFDDFTRLVDYPAALWIYKTCADVGRTLRLRLILIARGRLVKGLGSSGESDLREHFVFVTLRREGHTATLEMDGATLELDTRDVLRLAQPLGGERWYVPVPSYAPFGAGNGHGTGNGTGTEDGTPLDVLVGLVRAGLSRDQAHAAGFKFKDTKWTDALRISKGQTS